MTDSARDAAPSGALSDIVDRAQRVARRDRVALRDVLDAFGHASYVPALLVPALAVVTPLSGIPGFSGFCGIVIFLIAVQWVVERDHIWLPRWVLRRRIDGARLHAALGRIRHGAAWLDEHTRPRLRFLFRAPVNVVPRLACALCGGAMPFLELVPLSSSLLGAATTLLSFSMLTRDGLYALAALIPLAAAVWVIASLVG